MGSSEQKPAPDRQPKTVSELGGFEILRKIGQGGMGVVYKARQKSLDRIVALKILPENLVAKDASFVERFRREALAAAKFNHPNIVQVIDVGKEAAIHYLAMEYVDGKSVKELLKARGKFNEKEALLIVRQVASALRYARDLGIVHRDIKPDNILVSEKGTAKLADLGLAKQVSSDEESALTIQGSTLGTPYYMSPEQAQGRKDIDIRSDLYSLGATLFHMVTGSTVFQGDAPVAVILKHVNEPAPDARKANPDVSEGCAKLIHRLLRKDPGRRTQTPAELVEQIDAVPAGESVKGGPATPRKREPTSHGMERAARSKTPLYIGMGATAAVVVIAVLVLSRGREPRRRPAFEAPVVAKPEEDREPVEENPAPVEEEKEPRGGAESMLAYLKEWETGHREDYEELLVRYEKVKKAAEGTAVEFKIADQVDEAVAAVRNRRQKAAEGAWNELDARVSAKTKDNDYDGALRELDTVPQKFSALLEKRAKRRAEGLRREAKGKISSAVKLAKEHLEKREPERGLRALAAAEGIRYAAGAAGVKALKAKLTEQKGRIGEIRAKEAVSLAEKRLAAILKDFTNAVVERRDADAARAVVRKAMREGDLKPLSEQVAALGQVADAIDEVRRLEREAIENLEGKNVDLRTKSGRRVRGKVQRIERGTIHVEVRLPGGGSAVMPVSSADLSDEQKKQFRGKYVPKTAPQKIAAALAAISGGDLKRAGELIGQAKDFPLSGHYARNLRELEIGAAAVAAEEAWKEISAFVEGHKKNLDKAGGKRLLAMLAEFEKTHLKTKSGAPHRERLAELKEWAGNAVVGFDIEKTFKGKIESYDPDTRAISLFYDWEDEAQIEDWESPFRVDYQTMKRDQPWTDNVVIRHERWGGKLRKKLFDPMTATTKAVFTGDIEFSFDYEGRNGHAQLVYRPKADSKTWSAIRIIAPNSHSYQFKDKVGVCVYRKAGFGYRNTVAPAENLLPADRLGLGIEPALKGVVSARYVLKVVGRRITWSVNGKEFVSSWTPKCSEDVFPEKRAEQRPTVFLHMHMRTQDVAFDNIRIKGTLQAEWVKKMAEEYRKRMLPAPE